MLEFSFLKNVVLPALIRAVVHFVILLTVKFQLFDCILVHAHKNTEIVFVYMYKTLAIKFFVDGFCT